VWIDDTVKEHTMTPLQQRMIEDMTVRGLVPSTQRAYLRAVRNLAAYDKRGSRSFGAKNNDLL
jgi:hypothetical protein